MTGVLISNRFIEGVHDLPKDIGHKVWKTLRIFFRAPKSTGLHLELLNDHVYSMRVDPQYRIILHQPGNGAPTLLFVGKHDEAYRFVECAPEWQTAEWEPDAVDRKEIDYALRDEIIPSSPRERPETYKVPAEPTSVEVIEKLIRTRKYLPLAMHLLDQEGKPTRETTFDEIEGIISDSLPKSAFVHRAWWANDPTHAQAAAWLSVGWHTSGVDLAKKLVIFKSATQPLTARAGR